MTHRLCRRGSAYRAGQAPRNPPIRPDKGGPCNQRRPVCRLQAGVGVHNLSEHWLAGSGSLFDLDKVLVRSAAIQRRVRAQVVVEELVLKEPGRDVGDGERAVVSVPSTRCGRTGWRARRSRCLQLLRLRDFQGLHEFLCGEFVVGDGCDGLGDGRSEKNAPHGGGAFGRFLRLIHEAHHRDADSSPRLEETVVKHCEARCICGQWGSAAIVIVIRGVVLRLIIRVSRLIVLETWDVRGGNGSRRRGPS